MVLDCLVCSCSAGDLVCSQRPCAAASAAAAPAAPCRCPPHRVPVCGRNGRTYGNACLARCAGLRGPSDTLPGPCSLLDPCSTAAVCPGKRRCLADKKLCLSLLVPCPQYECGESLTSLTSLSPQHRTVLITV